MNDREPVVGWESASTITGLKVCALRKLASEGRLQTSRDDKGRHVFVRADLAALAGTLRTPDASGQEGSASPDASPQGEDEPSSREQEGLTAAKVLTELEQGMGLTAIVIKHQLPIETVRTLADQWSELKRQDLNQPSVPQALAVVEDRLAKMQAKLARLEAALFPLSCITARLEEAERGIGMLRVKTEHFGRVQPENLKCKCGETGRVSLEVVREECGESWLLL